MKSVMLGLVLFALTTLECVAKEMGHGLYIGNEIAVVCPNKQANCPERDRAVVINKMFVGAVECNSSVRTQGLRKGDEILSINGRVVYTLLPYQFAALATTIQLIPTLKLVIVGKADDPVCYEVVLQREEVAGNYNCPQ